ncbi:MAG: Fe/S biosis protein NfuA [Thermoleophilaceae bacterium]|nr:Fe/S biosis protein NfuA [Thermoleophilaceae bacterium]
METPPLAITEQALERVKSFVAGAPDPEAQAMWVEVTGIQAGEFTYNMTLKPRAAAALGDSVQDQDGLTMVVPETDVEALRGATVDWEGDAHQGGLKLVNPNRPEPASPAMTGGAELDMSAPLTQRIHDIVEYQVNPAIAAHGGRAELVAVEEPVVYVRLHGGCQGCGMASVTLTQGIEVAIRDHAPEIEKVVDVTDHASGSNPYFEAAKK